MTDFKTQNISQDNKTTPKHLRDVLVGSFCRLKYKDLQNRYNQNQTENFIEFNKAKESIKQKIIDADKSQDNSLVYTVITQFKKDNG